VSAGGRTLERERPRLTGRAAALLIVVTVLGMLLLVPVKEYVEQRGRVAELEREAARLEQQNDGLRSEIASLHDPVELERLARACLGMVRAGEIALVLPGERADTGC
jgi:cell division protein FtsB